MNVTHTNASRPEVGSCASAEHDKIGRGANLKPLFWLLGFPDGRVCARALSAGGPRGAQLKANEAPGSWWAPSGRVQALTQFNEQTKLVNFACSCTSCNGNWCASAFFYCFLALSWRSKLRPLDRAY